MLSNDIKSSKSGLANNFEQLLLEALNESLLILGESCRTAVYFYIERNVSLKRNEISKNLEAFCSVLQNIFGAGSLAMEILILRTLCEKVKVDYRNIKGTEFQVAVENIKKQYVKK